MTIRKALQDWLDGGGHAIGEIFIRPLAVGFALRHRDDATADASTLRHHSRPTDAREIGKYSADGKFRPVKTAPTLISGWEMVLPDLDSLHAALDFFYPAALANWLRIHDGSVTATPLKEMFGRQTGMYRITGLIQDAEAQEIVAKTCQDSKCLRKVLWPWTPEAPWEGLPAEKCTPVPHSSKDWPLYCIEACPLLVGAARRIVRRRLKPEAAEEE